MEQADGNVSEETQVAPSTTEPQEQQVEQERSTTIPRERFDVVYDELKVLREDHNSLMRQMASNQQGQSNQQSNKRPLEDYSSQQLENMKEEHPEYSVAINEEVRVRSKNTMQTQIDMAINKKVNELAVLNVHEDFKNPGSEMSQTLNAFLAERPYLRDAPDGQLIAAQLVMSQLGVVQDDKSKIKAREALAKNIEGTVNQTILKGGGEQTSSSPTKDWSNMSSADFEKEKNAALYGG